VLLNSPEAVTLPTSRKPPASEVPFNLRKKRIMTPAWIHRRGFPLASFSIRPICSLAESTRRETLELCNLAARHLSAEEKAMQQLPAANAALDTP
jgi:hypothetical protein